MPTLFSDDHVALKEDPSILATVETTWRETDGYDAEDEIIHHPGVSKRSIIKLTSDGVPPPNYVVIKFVEPFIGCSMVLETDLILVDRALAIGDLVKRNASDVESGTVIQQSTLYDLESTMNPDAQADLWSHQGPCNMLFQIPEEDLKISYDFEVGDYIIWRNVWVGIVSNVRESVTLRLDNGSIVKVRNADELDVPDRLGGWTVRSSRLSLASALRKFYQRAPSASRRRDLVRAEDYYVGQRVYTRKANLRLGTWIYGAYDAAIEPRGIVVNVETIQASIIWMASNLFADTHLPVEPAPNVLTTDDFPHVLTYNRNMTASTNAHFGTRHSMDLGLGEYVRFRNISAAATKYSDESSLHGQLKRIPRTTTQGFDMNVFSIRSTKSEVTVQWQDGSTTAHPSIELLPHLHSDDHDLWPGETVVLRDDLLNEPTIRGSDLARSDPLPRRMGIVQSVNGKDRVADVRWYQRPHLMGIDDQHSIVLPASDVGPLSDEITQVSVYEAVAYPGLNNRRGDLVLVGPALDLHEESLSSPTALPSSDVGQTISSLCQAVPTTAHGSEQGSSPTWFGEVVDLGLDGLLTVRLGALHEIRDVRVPMERLVTVLSGDDESLLGVDDDDDDDDDDEASWTDDSITADGREEEEDSEPIINTKVEYEGGKRFDSDGEDIWTTEDEGESISARRRLSNVDTSPSTNGTNGRGSHGPASKTVVEDHEDLHLSTYHNLPLQYLILDGPEAADHYFANQTVSLSAPLLRRIRREHGILESSLPEGVWVRTWADRLDLMRVLILGARDTPYELAPFVMDFQFHADFPTKPPKAHFHSWTQGTGRINPNLYEDGKCCLSLLGTWDTNLRTEGWSTDSSMLQIIVSVMALVLVKEPYYNEAGFEDLVGTPESRVSSAMYSEKALVMSKGFVVYALSHTVSALDDVLHWLYLATDGPRLLQRVVNESMALLGHDGQPGAPWRANNTHVSAGARIMLRRHVDWLRNKLNGLE